MNKLNKYTLHEELGRGGYGTVYRATDSILQVERAVKVLNPALVADPEFIERFRDEARLVARLKHHHIVPVYDLGEDQGYIYLAMEYMPGGSVKDLLQQEGPLPYARALQILEQVADALDYAHAQGLVHRDIKPQNILLDAEGRAYLSDFGFAKSLASADSSTSMSLTGGILGTPAYMSPEAWDGKGWTPAADVYSLACVFCELLTGSPLFDGETPTRIMKQHVIEGPQFPATWPEGTSDGLAAALEKGLAQEPEERYPSAGAFVQAVSDQPSAVSPKPAADSGTSTADSEKSSDTGAPETAPPETKPPDTPLWQRWYLWAGIAVLAVIIAALAWPKTTPDTIVQTVVVTAPQVALIEDTATVAPTAKATNTPLPSETPGSAETPTQSKQSELLVNETYQIHADRAWNLITNVKEGETIHITVISGKWRGDADGSWMTGKNCDTFGYDSNQLVPSAAGGGLIAMVVGGDAFCVPGEIEFESQYTGSLLLSYNDCMNGCFEDNEGSLFVKVEIRE